MWRYTRGRLFLWGQSLTAYVPPAAATTSISLGDPYAGLRWGTERATGRSYSVLWEGQLGVPSDRVHSSSLLSPLLLENVSEGASIHQTRPCTQTAVTAWLRNASCMTPVTSAVPPSHAVYTLRVLQKILTSPSNLHTLGSAAAIESGTPVAIAKAALETVGSRVEEVLRREKDALLPSTSASTSSCLLLTPRGFSVAQMALGVVEALAGQRSTRLLWCPPPSAALSAMWFMYFVQQEVLQQGGDVREGERLLLDTMITRGVEVDVLPGVVRHCASPTASTSSVELLSCGCSGSALKQWQSRLEARLAAQCQLVSWRCLGAACPDTAVLRPPTPHTRPASASHPPLHEWLLRHAFGARFTPGAAPSSAGQCWLLDTTANSPLQLVKVASLGSSTSRGAHRIPLLFVPSSQLAVVLAALVPATGRGFAHCLDPSPHASLGPCPGGLAKEVAGEALLGAIIRRESPVEWLQVSGGFTPPLTCLGHQAGSAGNYFHVPAILCCSLVATRPRVERVCGSVWSHLQRGAALQQEVSGGEGEDFPTFSPTLFICSVETNEGEEREAMDQIGQSVREVWATLSSQDVTE